MLSYSGTAMVAHGRRRFDDRADHDRVRHLRHATLGSAPALQQVTINFPDLSLFNDVVTSTSPLLLEPDHQWQGGGTAGNPVNGRER